MEDLPEQIAAMQALAKEQQEKIDALIDAHRALATEHTALAQFFIAMLPCLEYDRAAVLPETTRALDEYSQLVEQQNLFDPEYERALRRQFDSLVQGAMLPHRLKRPKTGC